MSFVFLATGGVRTPCAGVQAQDAPVVLAAGVSQCTTRRHECSLLTLLQLAALNIRDVASFPCVVFLWCGDEEGLEGGRQVLDPDDVILNTS